MLEVSSLTVSSASRPLLRDVSFQVAPGEVVGIVGEAGSGKSLLVHALAGLVSDTLTVTGTVAVDGLQILSLGEEERRGVLGKDLSILLPGGRARLNPLERVGSQIARVQLDHDDQVEPAHANERAIDLLGRLGLPDPAVSARSYPHQLSGGMAQRVLIAMALVNNARLMVADEPTNGLDVTVQRQVLEDLHRVVREAGVGLAIATSDLGLVAQFCDRVVVLHELDRAQGSTIAEIGTVSEFFKTPRSRYGEQLLEATARERRTSPIGAGALALDAERPEPLVEVRDLVKIFPVSGNRELVAVNHVDLNLQPGETLGLVGESGSGKTTLGRALLHLLPPTSGEIWFEGINLAETRARELRAIRPRVQMVFQDPTSSLNPRMTIRQALADATSRLPLSKAERATRIERTLSLTDISPQMADAHPAALTSGQQQRCAIARALVMEPDVIVLDEPTSALDVTARSDILDLLRSIQERMGVSYLFISHDLTAVRRISHRVAVMYLGRIVEQGSTTDIFRQPLHPYTRSLLSAVLYPDPDARVQEHYRLEGEIPSPIDLPDGCPLYARCPIREQACLTWPPELLAVTHDGTVARAAACRRVDEVLAGTVAPDGSEAPGALTEDRSAP